MIVWTRQKIDQLKSYNFWKRIRIRKTLSRLTKILIANAKPLFKTKNCHQWLQRVLISLLLYFRLISFEPWFLISETNHYISYHIFSSQHKRNLSLSYSIHNYKYIDTLFCMLWRYTGLATFFHLVVNVYFTFFFCSGYIFSM